MACERELAVSVVLMVIMTVMVVMKMMVMVMIYPCVRRLAARRMLSRPGVISSIRT